MYNIFRLYDITSLSHNAQYPIQHRNIAAALQKYFIARLQHYKNIAKYYCNISATLQQCKNVRFKNIDT